MATFLLVHTQIQISNISYADSDNFLNTWIILSSHVTAILYDTFVVT